MNFSSLEIQDHGKDHFSFLSQSSQRGKSNESGECEIEKGWTKKALNEAETVWTHYVCNISGNFAGESCTEVKMTKKMEKNLNSTGKKLNLGSRGYPSQIVFPSRRGHSQEPNFPALLRKNN